jgi:dTMP kinase
MVQDPTLPTTNPMSEVLLYASSRAETVKTTITPMLTRGYNLIGDRSWLSDLAYQGVPRVLDGKIRSANKLALGEYIEPDLLIILDADPQECHTRLTGNVSSYEQSDMKFDRKVRARYLKAARDMGGFVIDAMPPIEEVQHAIRQTVQERLGI